MYLVLGTVNSPCRTSKVNGVNKPFRAGRSSALVLWDWTIWRCLFGPSVVFKHRNEAKYFSSSAAAAALINAGGNRVDMSVSEGEEEPEADSHGSPRNRKFLLTPSKKKKKKILQWCQRCGPTAGAPASGIWTQTFKTTSFKDGVKVTLYKQTHPFTEGLHPQRSVIWICRWNTVVLHILLSFLTVSKSN